MESGGRRGWLNIGFWEGLAVTQQGREVCFRNEMLEICFLPVCVTGSCPAEKDNAGCFFLGDGPSLRPAEVITANKEFCDCRFSWRFGPGLARGESCGKTLPAIPTEVQKLYPRQDFSVENAAAIPCQQVLGSYVVRFLREEQVRAKNPCSG